VPGVSGADGAVSLDQPRALRHAAGGPGAGAALNSGLRAARGRWITYLDDDDVVYPFHLDALWSQVRETGALFAYSDYVRVLVDVDADHVPVPLGWRLIGPWRFSLDELLVQNSPPIHTWMHDREEALALGGFREDSVFYEDWDFLLRFAQRHRFVSTEIASAEYRFYLNAITNTIATRGPQLLQQLDALYRRFPLPPDAQAQEAERRLVRQAIRLQGEQVKAIQAQRARGRISAADATRHIISLVTSMPLDDDIVRRIEQHASQPKTR
jgi:hypothetical protein